MIFPKNEHLKICMYTNALLGVWPYIFENNPTLKKLYDIYSKATFTYYLLFILTAIIQLIILLTREEINAQEIFANLSITLLYSATISRVYAIKSTRLRKIIREVMDLENETMASGDKDVIEIYDYHSAQSKISNVILLVNIFLVTGFYFFHPLFVDDIIKFDADKNATVVIKALILSSWFPYDEQEHYVASYLWQILDGCIGASFVTYTDIFTFSLIIFPLGQIKILKHILLHFDEYAMKIKNQIDVTDEEASFITLRQCISKHNAIIRYVNDFNKSMRNVMVLDFLQSSIQLASVVVTLFVNTQTISLYINRVVVVTHTAHKNPMYVQRTFFLDLQNIYWASLTTQLNLFNCIFFTQFVVCMLTRLLVYYWYANEITVESSNIAVAIWESKWYKESNKVKNLMLIMMMRCNRVLCLEIGPFNTMSLDTLIGILKATYSYMMVVYRT